MMIYLVYALTQKLTNSWGLRIGKTCGGQESTNSAQTLGLKHDKQRAKSLESVSVNDKHGS